MRPGTAFALAVALLLAFAGCGGRQGADSPGTPTPRAGGTSTSKDSRTTTPRSRGPALTRQPYLQSCQTDSVVVLWQTDAATEGAIEYGTGDNFGASATDGTKSTTHAVRITGLQPATVYNYRVKSGVVELAKGSFKTNPEAGDAKFSFAAMGDSGSGSTEQYEVARVLANAGVDLAIHVGDVVYPSGEADLYDANFFRPYSAILSRICLYPLPGNHDLITDDGKPFFDTFMLPANNPAATERYYSFDYGDAHFVALDTTIRSGREEFSSEESRRMKEWLASDLRATTRKWKFVYLQSPPYSSGSKHGSDLAVRETFSPVFEEYGVAVVFSGDDHNYERTLPVRQYAPEGPGVVYVVTGGAGARIRPVGTSGFTGFAAQQYHFVKVTVGSESVKLEAVDRQGVVFDSYEIGPGVLAAPYTGTADEPKHESYLIVCARDSADKSDCDFQADGENDQVEMRQAVAACGNAPCTVLLSDGTFSNRGTDDNERIILRRGVKFLFGPETHLDFSGSDVDDRYVIDIDGTNAPARDVYVGGPGLISVNLAADHVIRIKGDVADVVIGDGLRITHNNGAESIDEGIQVTGSNEVRNLTIRDFAISNFGGALGAAHGIEFAGLVHHSLIDGYTALETQNGLALRGDCERVTGLYESSATGGLAKRPDARDNDPATTARVNLGPGAGMFIRSGGRFNSIKLLLASGNTRPANLTLAVSDGSGGWVDVEVVRDGMAEGEIPLAQEGSIEFDLPPGGAWLEDSMGGEKGYWARLLADAATDGISVAEGETCQIPYGNKFTDLIVRGSTTAGISLLSSRQNTFTDSLLESNLLDGVRSGQVLGIGQSWGNSFINIRVLNNKGNGYALRDSPGTVISGGVVSGNTTGIVQEDGTSPDSRIGGEIVVELNRGNGLIIASDRTEVRSATVRNNGADTDLTNNFRSGVRIISGDDVTVTGSQIFDDQSTPTQSFGVQVLRGVKGATVTDNRFAGNAQGPLQDLGSGTKSDTE